MSNKVQVKVYFPECSVNAHIEGTLFYNQRVSITQGIENRKNIIMYPFKKLYEYLMNYIMLL